MKKILVRWVFSLLLFIAVFAAAITYYVNYPVVFERSGIVFNVPVGMSKKTMIESLKTQGIVKRNWLFSFYVVLHYKEQLKAGEYLLPQGATPASIWRQVSSGKGFYYHSFSIIPGWTFSQLRQQLDQAKALKHLTTGASEEAIMTFLGHPDVKPEGQFYPETYYYTRGDQDLVILQRAFDLMQKRFADAWESRSANLPYKTPYEGLIAASIIEKEAYLDDERPMIAGVMVNRLNKGMLLQFDPTVIYGLGSRYDGKIYKKDLLEDTPYNTYAHTGLTPTPISMPSYASISAALHPAQHQYYYFVAKGGGAHQFSETLAAHHAAVDQLKANLPTLRDGVKNTPPQGERVKYMGEAS